MPSCLSRKRSGLQSVEHEEMGETGERMVGGWRGGYSTVPRGKEGKSDGEVDGRVEKGRMRKRKSKARCGAIA